MAEIDGLEIANAGVDKLVQGDYRLELVVEDCWSIAVDMMAGIVELDKIESVVVGKWVEVIVEGNRIGIVLVGKGIAVLQREYRMIVVVHYYCIDLDIDFEMVDDRYYPVN